jgi:hypothetical protein
MFSKQYIPDFFVAEHYGLRNTASWGSKDLASGLINNVLVIQWLNRSTLYTVAVMHGHVLVN